MRGVSRTLLGLASSLGLKVWRTHCMFSKTFLGNMFSRCCDHCFLANLDERNFRCVRCLFQDDESLLFLRFCLGENVIALFNCHHPSRLGLVALEHYGERTKHKLSYPELEKVLGRCFWIFHRAVVEFPQKKFHAQQRKYNVVVFLKGWQSYSSSRETTDQQSRDCLVSVGNLLGG
jgi:hypothetical protein